MCIFHILPSRNTVEFERVGGIDNVEIEFGARRNLDSIGSGESISSFLQRKLAQNQHKLNLCCGLGSLCAHQHSTLNSVAATEVGTKHATGTRKIVPFVKARTFDF